MKKNTIGVLCFILWYLVIWGVSSIPSKSLVNIEKFSLDKIAHFSIYLVLGVLFNRISKENKLKPKWVFTGFLFLVASSMFEEYHQKWIPGRSVSIFDWLANLSGLTIAYLFGFIHDKS
ncbi:MAG: VanZ family protein [Candidatus Cloacimonetes bacterium]|nr:VanZ family protein [Candidatus Cloacimonadota bacterium]